MIKKEMKIVLLAVCVLFLIVSIVFIGTKRRQEMLQPVKTEVTRNMSLTDKKGGTTAMEKNPEEPIQVDETTYYGGIVTQLKNMTPGVDYMEGQVISTADSKGAAKKIAKSLNAELLSYSEGVAIYSIDVTVPEFMLMLAKANEEAIQVSPNYIYKTN